MPQTILIVFSPFLSLFNNYLWSIVFMLNLTVLDAKETRVSNTRKYPSPKNLFSGGERGWSGNSSAKHSKLPCLSFNALTHSSAPWTRKPYFLWSLPFPHPLYPTHKIFLTMNVEECDLAFCLDFNLLEAFFIYLQHQQAPKIFSPLWSAILCVGPSPLY